MDRNQLFGSLGDELNVIFAAAGFNIRKLMRAFALFLYHFFKLALIHLVDQLNQYCSNRFGKGRAQEGKNLPSKGFPSRIWFLHNRRIIFRIPLLLFRRFIRINVVWKGRVASAVFSRRTAPELPESSGKIEGIIESGFFRDLLAGVRIILQEERCPFHPPFIQIVHE